MSILINKDTKIITQGITGKTGQFHTEKVPGIRQRQELLRRRRANPRRRARAFSTSPSSVPSRKPPADRRHRLRHLRAAPVPPTPSGKPSSRPRPGHLHHRRHPRPRHADRAQQDEGKRSRAARRPCCSAPTAPASSPRTKSRSASCPATSTRRAASAWFRAPAR